MDENKLTKVLFNLNVTREFDFLTQNTPIYRNSVFFFGWEAKYLRVFFFVCDRNVKTVTLRLIPSTSQLLSNSYVESQVCIPLN